MIAKKYPKIETLWNRDKETFRVDPDLGLRCAEFGLIRHWHLTEKLDGTNVRVALHADGTVEFGGRTNRAQMPGPLLAHLQSMFTLGKMQAAFDANTEVILFGEGYGAKIQKGGGVYRPNASFRLFDVWVAGWWLNWDNVVDVAGKLGIETVPFLGIRLLPLGVVELESILGDAGASHVARAEGTGRRAEGVVARTEPLLFDRGGGRLMWKLKFRDFSGGKDPRRHR